MHPTQHATCSVATQRCNMQRCRIRWTRSCRRFSAMRPSARQYASPVVITSGLRGYFLTSVPSAVPRSTLQCSLVRGDRPVPRCTDAVPHGSPVRIVRSVPRQYPQCYSASGTLSTLGTLGSVWCCTLLHSACGMLHQSVTCCILGLACCARVYI